MKLPEPPPAKELIFEKSGKDLVNCMQDADLNKKLEKINNNYPYWDTFKYKVGYYKIDQEPSLLWSYNKLIRERSISTIKIGNLSGFEFKYNITNNTLRLLHDFDMHLGGALEGSIIPPEESTRYLISSIMEEAIASSQLEGAATTREIAKQMLRSERKPRTLDEIMILNNYVTIKRVLEIKDRPFSKDLILELHSLITKGTLKNKKNEGVFRENNSVNVVNEITGDIIYTPPTFDKLEQLMSSFCEFANHKESAFIHPIIKGIILHFLLSYIHPFVDGNGRTARALFYWYLISKGYWLVEYMSISKIIIKAPSQYAKSFLYTEYDENDLTYFIDYNLKSMDLALKGFQQYIGRKKKEKNTVFHLIKNEDINQRQAEIIKSLVIDNKKSFTVKEIQSRFAISYPTARADILRLIELEYINEKKYGNKLIFFRAKDFEKKVMSIVND